MLGTIAILIAAAAAVAALGLVWRRLDELTNEVRALRAMLEAREAPAPQQPVQAATRAVARPVVVAVSPEPAAPERAAARAPERESEPEPLFPAASDDPFDDGWVIRGRGGQRPRPAPQRQQPYTPPPPFNAPSNDLPAAFPSFPTVPSLPDMGRTPARPVSTRVQPGPLIAAVIALTAPALGFAFGAPPLAIGAVVVTLLVAILGVSIWRAIAGLSWVAAIGGGAWALWAASAGEALLPWSAGALVLVAAAALACAMAGRERASGAVLAGFCAIAAYTLVANVAAGVAAPLAALAAIVALAAIAGASAQRLELLHVAAWFAACAALLLLSARDEAVLWFAPAGAWLGGLFLACAAVRAPLLGARGTVIAATGAIAPILAALSLHGSGHGLGAHWALAAVLIVIALALGAILVEAARRAGSVSALGWAAFPLGFGAPAALMLAALMTLSMPFAAPALAALAAALMGVNLRWPHPLWRFSAAFAGVASAFAAALAIGLFMLASQQQAYAIAALGLALPAALAFAAAWAAGPRAPISATAFEGGAIMLAALALSGAARAFFAEGQAVTAPITYAEAGVHAALWAALAALLAWRGRKGAWMARQLGATVLALSALAAVLIGPATALNPLWGSWREPILGLPVLNGLALGFGLPALAAWGLWWMWRDRTPRGQIALGAAALLTAAWIGLEIRRAFHGALLAERPTTIGELGIYAAAFGAAVIAVTLTRGAALKR